MGPCLHQAGGSTGALAGLRAGRLQHLGELHLGPDLGGSAPLAQAPAFLPPSEMALPWAGQGPTRSHNARACHPKLSERKHPINLKTDGFFSWKNNSSPAPPPPSPKGWAGGCVWGGGGGRTSGGGSRSCQRRGGNSGKGQPFGALGVEPSVLNNEAEVGS